MTTRGEGVDDAVTARTERTLGLDARAASTAPLDSIATPSGGGLEGRTFDGRGDLRVNGTNNNGQGVLYECAASALSGNPASPSAALIAPGTSPWALAFCPNEVPGRSAPCGARR
jgi:hypothetical protein